MASTDPLEIQRELMFGSLDSLLNFYNRPEGQQLMQQLQQRASGQAQPFTPGVVNAQLANNADASAGQFNNERDMIRMAMGNAGLGGSGLETSALVNSQRQANGMTRAGRREITSRAELENYQAQERAQGQVQSYLAQKQANEAAARAAEVGLRSQMTMEGDASATTAQAGGYANATNGASGQSIVAGPSGQGGTSSGGGAAAPAVNAPPRPTQYGLSNKTLLMPSFNSGLAMTGSTGWSQQGNQMQNAQYQQAMQSFQQQQQQQAMDRAMLAQQRASWDSQYGAR